MIEIDLTNESTGKFPIYAALGVPEIWRYDSGEVFFYRLDGQQYAESSASATFPFLPAAVLARFIEQSKVEGQDAALDAFREWASASRPQA